MDYDDDDVCPGAHDTTIPQEDVISTVKERLIPILGADEVAKGQRLGETEFRRIRQVDRVGRS